MITADNKPKCLHTADIFYNNYQFRRSEEIYHHVLTKTPTLKSVKKTINVIMIHHRSFMTLRSMSIE